MNDRETESWQTRLTAMGCDVEGAIRRLGNDCDFYSHLFTTFIREKSWEDLASAMEKGNYVYAFESAHKLKGSTVTLGLTPLTDLIILLMNELRLIRDKKGEASEEKARLYCRDLVEMANCSFRFNGLDTVEMPGSINVEDKEMPDVKVGTVLRIVEK